jgi:glycosyltransferase involved in cell wall biosynthesis
VPDVRPYVLQAALAVAPIRIARGLQNKVLEALALGKATLAAPAAIAALDVRIGDDLLSPKSADEWVTMVCQLLDDPVRRGQLGHAGRRFAEEHHHWQTCLQPLVQLLPGVADSAEEHRHEFVEHH